MTESAPVVEWRGSTNPNSPLVVLLHGRGSNETEIIDLADRLGAGLTFAALRAPITTGPGGFAWFANRGIGRPIAESLREQMDWFRSWLDTIAPSPRLVVLIGFSGGAAFAGGLALDDPTRYAGVAVLYGTIPFEAGVPTTPGRLADLEVFHAQGLDDDVMPLDLMDRTWSYLTTESGSNLVTHRYPGGHAINPAIVESLAFWIHKCVGDNRVER